MHSNLLKNFQTHVNISQTPLPPINFTARHPHAPAAHPHLHNFHVKSHSMPGRRQTMQRDEILNRIHRLGFTTYVCSCPSHPSTHMLDCCPQCYWDAFRCHCSARGWHIIIASHVQCLKSIMWIYINESNLLECVGADRPTKRLSGRQWDWQTRSCALGDASKRWVVVLTCSILVAGLTWLAFRSSGSRFSFIHNSRLIAAFLLWRLVWWLNGSMV